MKQLYFIRHGLSQANVDDIWGGQIETPLTEVGREQAKQAGIKAQAEGLKFNLLVTSTLSRAKDTARIVARQLGYPPSNIRTEAIFNERSFGILDGTPNAKTFFEKHTYKDLDDVKGAETVEALQKRAETAYELLRSFPEKSILLVGHGAFGRALRRVINNQPHTDEFSGPLATIPNAEIIKLI